MPALAKETIPTVDEDVREDGPAGFERVVRYLDLVVIALGLPLFLIAGFPLLGWFGAAVGWGGQRLIQASLERKASQTEDPKGFFRLMAGSLIGRSWFLVLVIFATGLIERSAGLAAALLALVAFTTYLIVSVIFRPDPPKTEAVDVR